jgi:hypothetical protein
MTENQFAMSFPAISGGEQPVMQGHVDYCAKNGHATHSTLLEDGTPSVSPRCPRCGDSFPQGQWVVRDTDTGTNLADRTYATREDAEKFAASFNRYNEHERYGVAYLPTDEELAQCVVDMKVEILADIADGTQPVSVADFSTLHDYVDANCYAGLCDDDNVRSCWDVDTLIRVQEEVDAWLKAGRPMGKEDEAEAFINFPASPEAEWPTAEDLVKAMQRMVELDREAGEEWELEDLLEYADEMFPETPADDTEREAFHARAVGIMNEAKATMEQWLAQNTK